MGATDTLIDTMTGAAPPASCPPGNFQAAVQAAVARAKAALPAAEYRIDTAAALVLAGAVELLEEGRTARVGSPTDGGPAYVVNGQCSCPEFPTAPGHLCTHRLAYGIAKRATELLQAPPTPLTAPSGQAAWGPSDALDARAPRRRITGRRSSHRSAGDSRPAAGDRAPCAVPAADRRQALCEVCGPADDGACPGLAAARRLVYGGE